MIKLKRLMCIKWVAGFTVGAAYPVIKLSEGEFIYNDDGKPVNVKSIFLV